MTGRIIVLVGVIAVLAGCSRGMSDLEQYVQEVRSRSEAPIEPIPEIRQPELYAYQSRNAGLRDPFTPAVEEEETTETPGTGIKPDLLRRKEELESFSLDTLRMVGTFEQDERWALVKNKQGVIYRVKPGNYMGRNHGRISAIYDDRIELVEIVPDRAGGYIEQPAKLSIGE